jgi:hypothetical protein
VNPSGPLLSPFYNSLSFIHDNVTLIQGVFVALAATKIVARTESKTSYLSSLLSRLPVVCQARRSFGRLYRFFLGSGKTRLPKVRCETLE